MARKRDAQEPLLIATARSLGRAAGALVNMTQSITMNPSGSASDPESTKPETPHKKKSSAGIRRKRPTKRAHATLSNRAVRSRKASARSTITRKRGSSGNR